MYLNVAARYLTRTFRKLYTIGSVVYEPSMQHGRPFEGSGDRNPVKRGHTVRIRPYIPPLMSSYPVRPSSHSSNSQHSYRTASHGHVNHFSHSVRIPSQPWQRPRTPTPERIIRSVSSFHQHRTHTNNTMITNTRKRPKVIVKGLRRNPDGRKYPIISLVSYNLLAQDLMLKNMFLYRTDIPTLLQWEHRKRSLLKEILEINADVSIK